MVIFINLKGGNNENKICHVVLLALSGFIGYKWYQHEQWQQLMVSGYCEKDGTYLMIDIPNRN
ncbi:Uncharacterised protein [Actinobacillus equuli]|nr:Uncharacterised protein [Actinobacillus equuli]